MNSYRYLHKVISLYICIIKETESRGKDCFTYQILRKVPYFGYFIYFSYYVHSVHFFSFKFPVKD